MKFLILMIMVFSSGCAMFMTKEQRLKHDKALIKDAIKANLGKVQACYKESVKGLPDDKIPQGKVIYAWEFDDQGQAFNVRMLNSSLNHPATESCVVEVLKATEFPLPKKGMTVDVQEYPFVFVRNP